MNSGSGNLRIFDGKTGPERMHYIMPQNLYDHPSDIAKSAVEYLKTIKALEQSERIYTESPRLYLERIKELKKKSQLHADILFLFIEYLRSDPSAVLKTKDGKFLLSSNWDAYEGRVISDFIDWWLPRKEISNDFLIQVPRVLRTWIQWCRDHRYIDEKQLKNFMKALPIGKGKDVERLQKAGDLLYQLHTPHIGGRKIENQGKVVQITAKKMPEAILGGYMKILRIEKYAGFLETREGLEIGPVVFGNKLAKLLRTGDVIVVEIGRFGKYWKVLRSGNVYAKGTVF
jgi:hypothetical protein